MLNPSLWHPYENEIALSGRGETLKAIQRINSKLQQPDMKDEAIYTGLFWKAACYNYMGEFMQGKKCVNELLEKLESSDTSMYHWMFDAHLLLIWVYFGQGKIDQGLTSLENIKKKFKQLDSNHPKHGYRKSKLYLLEASLYKEKGNFKRAIPLYKKSLAISIDLQYLENSTLALCNIGDIYFRKGYLDKALKNLKQGKEIAKKHNIVINLLRININIGLVYYKKGDLYTASQIFENCLRDARKLQHKKREGEILGHLGNIARKKGDLTKAYQLLNTSLGISIDLNNKLDITSSYMDLANFYMEKNDTQSVKEYLMKALQLAQENGYTRLLGWVLYDLIRFLSDHFTQNKQQHFLAELNKLRKEQPDNMVFKQIYTLARGILLKCGRLSDLSKAQAIFRRVANARIVDHELTICALQNLVAILFTELKLLDHTQEQDYVNEIIDEIYEISDKFLIIAENQDSYSLFAKTYLIQAKMALIEPNIKQAQYLLNKAQNIAENKGLLRLAQLVSYEHDKLINNMKKWKLSEEQKESNLHFWLKEEELTATLERFIQNSFDIPFEDEVPTFLIITSKNGLSIYSRKFQPNSQVKSHLLGGFLSAVNSLGRTVLSPDNINDYYAHYRLRHGSHTIVVRPKKDLLFAYAFEGQSYGAIKKLELFIDNLLSLENIWNVLQQYGGYLPKPERETIHELSSSIFLSQKTLI